MSKEMEQFKETLAESLFGRSREDSFKSSDCVTCGESATEFRDELSAKEYRISGMCQECQDNVFGD